MPKDSKVGRMYDAMKKEGMSSAKAAKISQVRTGQALATGKTPKTGPMSHGAHDGGKKK